MIEELWGRKEAEIDTHEEKVHILARHIGGYMHHMVELFEPEEVPYVLPVDEFPQEIMEAIQMVQNGAFDKSVRRDGHLSYVFDLLRGENTMIYWEILGLAPEIAFYATGNLAYAQQVKEYLQKQAANIESF